MSNNNIEDVILLKKACNEWCNKSLDNLYRKFSPSIRNNCLKTAPNDQLDDAVQELFIRILVHKCKYKGDGSVEGFLCKIATNIIHEQSNLNKVKYSTLKQIEVYSNFLANQLTSIPIEEIETQELNQIIKSAISELPPKSRQAIELVYFYGISAKKAAELTKCEFKVFRNRLNYGLKQLHKKLEKYVFI